MAAHGTTSFIKETFLDRADNYKIFVCNICGNICVGNTRINKYYCKNCDNSIDFSEIRTPYAYKLFMQEIATMSMNIKIEFKNKYNLSKNNYWIDPTKLQNYTLPTFTKKIVKFLESHK